MMFHACVGYQGPDNQGVRFYNLPLFGREEPGLLAFACYSS